MHRGLDPPESREGLGGRVVWDRWVRGGRSVERSRSVGSREVLVLDEGGEGCVGEVVVGLVKVHDGVVSCRY